MLADAAKSYIQVEKVAQIGLVLPCAGLIGWLGGAWLDGHFHPHWMTITGFLLGCVAGMTTAIRMAMQLVADPAKKRNPGDGSDASQWDANPAFLRKRYQEKFLGPVTAMLAGMRGDAEQPNSPIMEAIQAIAVRDFGETGPSGDNALVVVSDLLEHTGHLDLYRGVPNAQVFAKSAEGRSLHADLNGVGVSVYLINRVKDAKFQTDALGTFWIQWLTQQGGDVGAFKQLPG